MGTCKFPSWKRNQRFGASDPKPKPNQTCIVPIFEEGTVEEKLRDEKSVGHWYLAVLAHSSSSPLSTTIYILDSLSGRDSHHRTAIGVLTSCLGQNHVTKSHIVEVAQQTSSSDCGVFTLFNMECIMSDLANTLTQLVSGKFVIPVDTKRHRLIIKNDLEQWVLEYIKENELGQELVQERFKQIPEQTIAAVVQSIKRGDELQTTEDQNDGDCEMIEVGTTGVEIRAAVIGQHKREKALLQPSRSKRRKIELSEPPDVEPVNNLEELKSIIPSVEHNSEVISRLDIPFSMVVATSIQRRTSNNPLICI